MKARITKKAVETLEPGKTIWDDKVIGFGARCQKKSVSYIVKTRVRGRQRLITIGKHGGPWTPETARREALRILADTARGVDPNERKRRERAKRSVDEIWKDFEVSHFSKLKPKTRADYRKLFRRHISPNLGGKALDDVARSDVAALHRKLKDKPRTANLVLAVLSKFMNWAEVHDLRPQNSNPVKWVKNYRENRRERFLSEDELQRLGKALDQELEGNGNVHAVAAIRLLILTGARLNEILTLKWEYVDLDNGVLLLPDSKTGRKTILLNDAAMELLRSLPKTVGNPHVICGNREGWHLVNLQKPWRRIRARAGLEDVRLHDLRHTFASFAARKGGSLPKIGALLGHSQVQTTQRYAHLVPEDLRRLANEVGTSIERTLTGTSDLENAGS